MRYTVGLRSAPRGLQRGDPFTLADGGTPGTIAHVEKVLRYVAVETRDPETFERCVSRDANVRYVERSVPLHALWTPNDPKIHQAGMYGPALIGAPAIWKTTRGSPNVTVCVADSGVHATHEDLAGDRYAGGVNLILGSAGAEDDNGHGTHVTGTIAASANNGRGITGIAQVSFKHAKVLAATGVGTSDVIASGIRWCAESGAHVISLSLGGDHARPIEDAVDYAWAKGALVVAAAGNPRPEGCADQDCVAYPAAYPRVVAVGCVDREKRLCPRTAKGPELDLVAPGLGILSTAHDGDAAYRALTGTSMSTPHVAGAAALLQSLHPDWDNFRTRFALERGAEDLGQRGHDRGTGHGLARVDRAALAPPPDNAAPIAEFTASIEGVRVRVDATPSSDPDGKPVYYLWEWGDGEVATGLQAEHVYDQKGSYTIRLTVVDDEGARASIARAVRIQAVLPTCAAKGDVLCVPRAEEIPASVPALSSANSYQHETLHCTTPDASGASPSTVLASESTMHCEINPPYRPFDEPDAATVRFNAKGKSCGHGSSPTLTANYTHNKKPVAHGETPGACPTSGTPSAAPASSPGAGDPEVAASRAAPAPPAPGSVPAVATPAQEDEKTTHPLGASTENATGHAHLAAPQAPAPPGGTASAQASEAPTPLEDSEGAVHAAFYRPVRDDGSVSRDFQEGPIDSAAVSVDGPFALEAAYATERARAIATTPTPPGGEGRITTTGNDASGAAASHGKTLPQAAAGAPAPAPAPLSPAPDRPDASNGPIGSIVPRGGVAPPPAATLLLIAATAAAAGLALLGSALYHRITGPRIADHPHRARILDILRATPGLTVTELAGRMGLHATTISYHLRLLAGAGILVVRDVNGQKRYAVPGSATEARIAEAALLRHPLPRNLLELVARRPGLTMSEAAMFLGASRFALRPHVHRLRAASLLQVRQDGTARRLYPATGSPSPAP